MAMTSHPRPTERREAKNARYHDRRVGAGIAKMIVMRSGRAHSRASPNSSQLATRREAAAGVGSAVGRSDPGDPRCVPDASDQAADRRFRDTGDRRGMAAGAKSASRRTPRSCAQTALPAMTAAPQTMRGLRSMTPRRIAIAAGLACWSAASFPVLAQPTPLLPPTGAPAGNGQQPYTRSAIATGLASPTLPTDAPPGVFLEAARTALQDGRTGEAQEALERAETRLLDRPVGPAQVDAPDNTRAVLDIGVARQALAVRDRPGAIRAIDDALAASALAARPMPPVPVALSPAVVPAPAPPVPTVTYTPCFPATGSWTARGMSGCPGDEPAPGRGPAVRARALRLGRRSVDMDAKPFWGRVIRAIRDFSGDIIGGVPRLALRPPGLPRSPERVQ